MAIPGERFVLDLSDDEDQQSRVDPPRASPLINLIGEIKERAPKAPVAPTQKSSTGFPAAKDRRRGSAFKQRRAAAQNVSAKPSVQAPTRETGSVEEEEKRAIDEENRQRLATMSEEEIERERAELMSNLSPSLVERLMRRTKIADKPSSSAQQDSAALRSAESNRPKTTTKSVSFDLPEPETAEPASNNSHALTTGAQKEATTSTQASEIDDRIPTLHPSDLRPASEFPTGPIHFPTPPPRQDPMPNLDPTSPSFYADLQAHYFPETPHDPSALSWLKPSENDSDDLATSSPYHPSSSAVTVVPSALRFSLRGEILPPSTSLSLSTSLGLHHHADDPEAAGYTISELSILSRSTVPTQRCIAWQVLGRILYRLGKDELGEPGSDLVEGLWTVIEREAVVTRMLDEAEGGQDREEKGPRATGWTGSNIGKHASAKAWAVEGIWLWQMGGGNRGIPQEESAGTH
ncbi:putative transcription factor Rba50 [Talaromyces proteolyticus]|uniref:Transcription factor Rba50 n=1 Tax=Talaromyces proteolyticus TaxID=1131652 RepID=A0AAD4PTH5_9EURO|nr:putative transcription factor Rba50 [Talaromyces proteolyticus]KAH8688758.1 putative transcription factor Rba50 [Talaromyces proteolyticus]